jgi:motility quorum-sensing regulator/GCU-specific mRNA interferase toxin
MEKSTAHCKLVAIRVLVENGQVKATASAFAGARELGINNLSEMCKVIMSLTSANFYKSMTTHIDHRIWQDVYHSKNYTGYSVYLKLTVLNDVVIVSFKEL